MQVGLGCWQFGPSFGFWENQDKIQSLRTIRLGLKSGLLHFDTAQSYNSGQSEQLLGSVIKTYNRESLFIASKIMPTTTLDLKKVVNKSLSRLGLEYLDLLYIHYPQENFDYKQMLNQLVSLQKDGIIRSIGLSNFGSEDLLRLSETYPIAYFQRAISPLWTKDLDKDLSICKKANIKVVSYSPLGLGLLSGRYDLNHLPSDSRQNLFCFKEESRSCFANLLSTLSSIGESKEVCYSWLKSKNPDVVLIGARSPQQLSQNLEILSKEKSLSEDEIQRIDEASAALMKTVESKATNLFLHQQ